jgi:hypothetical protein
MEQSGRKQWQPVATRSAAKTAQTSQNHGKEGVRGSSPREGFRKFLLISSFRCRRERQERAAASTERPRAGEFFDDTTSNGGC